MENKQQISAYFKAMKNNHKNKDTFGNMEMHSLSLRKKLNNKAKRYILPNSLANDVAYEINLIKIEPKIRNHQLYREFINSQNENKSISLLFQMLLLENNDDFLKFSLENLKKYLIDIDEKNFISKNISTEFNDKMIKYLYDLLFKKSNDFFILSNILFILNKLSILIEDENYFNILFNNFGNILNLALSINKEEAKIKNLLYYLSSKIFLGNKEIISKLEKTYPRYILQVHSEIKGLEQNKLLNNIILISTLLNIINNCFFFKIYSEYFFSSYNNMKEINVENIFKFIQNLLNCSYEMIIMDQVLRCIQNFICFFLEEQKFLNNSILKKKTQKILNDLHLEEKIIPLIYDSSIKEPAIRDITLNILVNATFIASKNLCQKLIDNDIAKQIIKLEQYLISQIHLTNRIKSLYRLLLNLIYNLVENESVNIIENLSIENNCISLLFKLQKIPFYSNENKKYMINIFHILIQSNHKYIQTLLISEGICEWYKSILEDTPSSDNIEMIISDFITMKKYSANLVKDDNNKNNLLLIHLEKIGILELSISLKGRSDIPDEVLEYINEFSNWFNINKI